jgi:hypothetical protein
MTKWQVRRGRTDSVGPGKWTRSLVLLCEREVSSWLLDVGLYSARPAERFARRMPISLPQKASLAAHRLPQRTILACTRPVLVGHAVELATAQPPPTTTAKSKPKPPLAQHREPVMDAAGDHADPGHPSHRAVCPPPRSRTSLRPDTADAATHRHRTPTPDAHTGPRTADTWTLGWHRTLDTHRWDRQAWTLDARTGHRTLDAGRGRGQGDDGTVGIRTSWAAMPSDRTLGRPTVFLWTAPRRTAVLDDFGSSVERTATLHPLCRVANRGQAWVLSGARARCRYVWRR